MRVEATLDSTNGASSRKSDSSRNSGSTDRASRCVCSSDSSRNNDNDNHKTYGNYGVVDKKRTFCCAPHSFQSNLKKKVWTTIELRLRWTQNIWSSSHNVCIISIWLFNIGICDKFLINLWNINFNEPFNDYRVVSCGQTDWQTVMEKTMLLFFLVLLRTRRSKWLIISIISTHLTKRLLHAVFFFSSLLPHVGACSHFGA
jgi:hypothetical protein